MNIIKQWPVLLLLLAFAISPLFFIDGNNILVCIQILVLTVFVKGLLSSYQEFKIPFNSLALSICLFYIWMALSISWSPSPAISLYEFVWLTIFPLCFFTYSIKTPGNKVYLQLGILFITLIFAFIGIGQGLGFLSSDGGPIRSVFPTKNSFAAMLNIIALPVTAYFILPSKSNNGLSKLLGTILFIIFFTLFETGGRGSIISLFLGLIFIAVINWKYTYKLLVLKLLIILTTAFLFSNIKSDGYAIDRLKEMNKSIVTTGSIYQRDQQWKSSFQIIKTAPVIGTGIGTYYIVSPPYKHIDVHDPGYFAHNEYIQFWLETGIVGLSFIIMIAIAILRLFLFLLRHIDLKLQDRLEITGLIAGLLSIAIQSFFDFHFHIIAILMIMGLMCARVQEISHIYNPKLLRSYYPIQKISRKLFVLTVSIIPIIILNYSVPTAIADYYLNKAKKQIVAGEIEIGDLTLTLAAKWNPNSIPIYYQQYSLYRSILNIIEKTDSLSEHRALYTKTMSILKNIEDINPLTGIVPEGRGHLLVENSNILVKGWEKQAVNEFNSALKLNPTLFRSRLALARLLVQQGDLNEAVELMNIGVPYQYPDFLHGLDKFYKYAIDLNLMNGDTVKAKKIGRAKGLIEVN